MPSGRFASTARRPSPTLGQGSRSRLRVVDLSNPYRIEEVGYYIPKTNKNSHPIVKDQKVAIQMNDVDIDHRGFAYASDRVGTGLFVLEYTGPKPSRTPATETSN